MEDWVVLTNVANDIEFEIVKGVLELGNIPAIKKVKGIEGYLEVFTGVPLLKGTDILVPADRYEEAVKLLETEAGEEPEDER